MPGPRLPCTPIFFKSEDRQDSAISETPFGRADEFEVGWVSSVPSGTSFVLTISNRGLVDRIPSASFQNSASMSWKKDGWLASPCMYLAISEVNSAQSDNNIACGFSANDCGSPSNSCCTSRVLTSSRCFKLGSLKNGENCREGGVHIFNHSSQGRA